MRKAFNFNLKYLEINMKNAYSLFAVMLLLGCSNEQSKSEYSKSEYSVGNQEDSLLKRAQNIFPDTLTNDSSSSLYFADRAQVCLSQK